MIKSVKTLKTIFVLSIISFATVILCGLEYWGHTHFKASPIAQKARIFFLQKFVHPEEQEIWKEFARIGVQKDSFINQCQEFLPIHQEFDRPKQTKPLSPETRMLVEDILLKQGINPQSLYITASERTSPASATVHALYVNESLLNTHSQAGKRFIIKHESGHIHAKDNLQLSTLKNILKTSVQDACKKDINHPQCRFSRLTETRADIYAATQDAQAAQDFLIFMNETIQRMGYTPVTTHPKNSDRLALAHQINDYFNNQMTIA